MSGGGAETLLVTGGAGYIGSHAAQTLRDAGHTVVVLDNLSTGRRAAVPAGVVLVEGDVGDRACVRRVLEEHRVDSVMHLAASASVPESVASPLLYFRNNAAASLTLLEACLEAGVTRWVFSSTAAVYGVPGNDPVPEDGPTAPINPYGTSKLMTEWMLRDAAACSGLRYVALRYFNVAGADPRGRAGPPIGSSHRLVDVACATAAGLADHLELFGTDHPTPDGTALRDYIHVTDLVDAHLCAHRYLADGGESCVLNCGYGRGYSVREVLRAVERVAGVRLDIREQPARPGDPPVLIADAHRIGERLGWVARHDNLDEIVRSTLDWIRVSGAGRGA